MPKFTGGEIEPRETGEVVMPTVTRGIHGDGDVGVVLEKRDTVARLESVPPPDKISLAGGIEQDGTVVSGCEALGGQQAVGHEPAGPDDVGRVEQAAREGCQLLLRNVGFFQPGVDGTEERVQLLGGNGNGVFVKIIQNAECDAFRSRGGNVAWGSGQFKPEIFTKLDKGAELVGCQVFGDTLILSSM